MKELGFRAEERARLERGLLTYHLVFVEPLLELPRNSSLVDDDTAAYLQLAALVYWRFMDALLDRDPEQLAPARARDLAFQAVDRLRDVVQRAGLDWRRQGAPSFYRFLIPASATDPPPDTPGSSLIDAFLREHFEELPNRRASPYLLVPELLLRVTPLGLTWYRFYVAVLALDDDLGDIIADAIAGHDNATMRLMRRCGVFGPGRAAEFAQYHRFLAAFLEDRFLLASRTARARGFLAAAFALDAVLGARRAGPQ